MEDRGKKYKWLCYTSPPNGSSICFQQFFHFPLAELLESHSWVYILKYYLAHSYRMGGTLWENEEIALEAGKPVKQVISSLQPSIVKDLSC